MQFGDCQEQSEQNPAHKPFIPSIILKALIMPTTAKTVKGTPHKPSSKLIPRNETFRFSI